MAGAAGRVAWVVVWFVAQFFAWCVVQFVAQFVVDSVSLWLAYEPYFHFPLRNN